MKSALFVLLLVCIVGCGNEDGKGRAALDNPSTVGQEKPPNVVSPTGIGSESPALHLLADVPADASPAEVVSAAINAWQSGDERKFKALLTHTAQIEIRKLNFEMQNLPPSVKFEVRNTEYVTENQEAAHVHFVWSESNPNGGPVIEQEAFWLLRRLPNVGWRISGMGNTGDAQSKQPDIIDIDFENAQEMARIWDLGDPRNAKREPAVGGLQR